MLLVKPVSGNIGAQVKLKGKSVSEAEHCVPIMRAVNYQFISMVDIWGFAPVIDINHIGTYADNVKDLVTAMELGWASLRPGIKTSAELALDELKSRLAQGISGLLI